MIESMFWKMAVHHEDLYYLVYVWCGLIPLSVLYWLTYICQNHTDIRIHSDHGYLDTLEQPLKLTKVTLEMPEECHDVCFKEYAIIIWLSLFRVVVKIRGIQSILSKNSVLEYSNMLNTVCPLIYTIDTLAIVSNILPKSYILNYLFLECTESDNSRLQFYSFPLISYLHSDNFISAIK